MINFPIPSADGELFTDTDGVLWIAEDADLPLQENVRWVRRGSAIRESLAIGAFMNFGGATAPAGYLVCDGASYKKTDYPDLYSAIGDLWANTGSVVSPPTDEFRVPPQNVDGLGLYLRGDGSSTVVGEYQGDVFKAHNHVPSSEDRNFTSTGGTGTSQFGTGTSGRGSVGGTSLTGDPTETRPRSITTLLCIKATFSSFSGDLGNIPVNSVGSDQIIDGAVTDVKLADQKVSKSGDVMTGSLIVVRNNGDEFVKYQGEGYSHSITLDATGYKQTGNSSARNYAISLNGHESLTLSPNGDVALSAEPTVDGNTIFTRESLQDQGLLPVAMLRSTNAGEIINSYNIDSINHSATGEFTVHVNPAALVTVESFCVGSTGSGNTAGTFSAYENAVSVLTKRVDTGGVTNASFTLVIYR